MLVNDANPADQEPLSVTVYGPVEERTNLKKTAGTFKARKWRDLLRMGFEALLDFFANDPLTFDQFLAVTGDYIDSQAEEISQKEKLRYVGGECLFTVNREYERVEMAVKLYFKNAEKKWVLTELHGKTAFLCFTAEALDNEITAIMRAGSKKMPIVPPKK